MTTLEKAQRYLDRVPPAVSGSGGHDQTFAVACILVKGFNLTPDEAAPLMRDYSNRCQPPWAEKDIIHKLQSADSTADSKPRGYLIGSFRHTYKGSRAPEPQPSPAQPIPAVKPMPKGKVYDTSGTVPLPPAWHDGARELLLAAFGEGEGICIARARTNDEGKEVPEDGGTVLSREEWLAKLDVAGGDPNKFLSTSSKNGLYIRCNPVKPGGTKDGDVTTYRHALLEFDKCSIEEQWSILHQSRVPATCIIHSGGKSLHAWVKIDAKDRKEFDERVRVVYEHFAAHLPDVKNKNPSRFSRLPCCVRGDSRQELLGINTGAESFSAWLMEHELEDLGEEYTVKDLLAFQPDSDKDSVIGNRWLCKGGSCLLIAPSGVGKSSLEMQLAMTWALERSAWGIQPARGLKSLIIQAENDLGDMAEMFQGIWRGMKIGHDPELMKIAIERIKIRSISSSTGKEFVEKLHRLIDRERPDLVWLDPVLAFIGDDVSKQAVVAQFFRNWINPILKATGAILFVVHHTGKPKDAKSRAGFTLGDYSYEGTGSSDMVNWARAVITLRPHDNNVFELMLPKRGSRAGMTGLDGAKTKSIWLQHASHVIHWMQADKPKEEAPKGKGKTPLSFDFDGFIETIRLEHFTTEKLCELAGSYGNMPPQTFRKLFLEELKSRLDFDPRLRTYTAKD